MEHTHRNDRLYDQVRPIFIEYDVYGYADASILLSQGNTKVLVGVTLQQGVPPFLKGQRTGWLSAEYAMLPHATHQRSQRESSQTQRNARSVEISRLIGRCLRPTVNLNALGERTIVIDCDVLQADGGTRVACITAASLALKIAATRWHTSGMLDKNVFVTRIAGLSLGVINGKPLVDLSYDEDSQVDADFNFVMTEQGDIVEIQGTSEKAPVSWDVFDELKILAQNGIASVFASCKTSEQTPTHNPVAKKNQTGQEVAQPQKIAAFSLGSRLQKK